MCVTDPPFGISNNGTNNDWIGYRSNKGDWDVVADVAWVNGVCSRLVDGGTFVTFGVFGSLVPIFIQLEMLGMRFQSHPVWEKSNPAPSVHRRMYTFANELILVYTKGSNWIFNYDIAKNLNGGKQLKNVWRAGSVRRILQRTRKPAYVLDRLILPLTGEGDVVVDPFCGTCSIVERAAHYGCDVYGIDNDREVIEWSRDWLESLGYTVVVEYV